jgi:replicative DNA helicase
VIDYFGLLEAATRRNNEAMELGEISRGLKLAAMELDCPFVVPAQLNREADGANEEPRLKHLRGTGSLEQDADLVIFLHRPAHAEQSALIEDRKVIIAKQRDGWTGAMDGKFDKSGLIIFTTGDAQ